MDSDRQNAIPAAGELPPKHSPDPVATQPWSPDTAAAPPAAQATGVRLGDYEILEVIAQGGMGVVYKARQISLQRIVALKRIRQAQVSDEDERRFLAEAAAIARLDHPHIVPIFHVGREQGELFLAMGLVEGQSMQRRLDGDPLAPRDAAACLAKVSAAMAYAHSQGVIHRDLKPSNILIDQAGEPKVIDFGLAKQGRDSSLTATGQVLGTPSYMPPEQAAGSGQDVTASADVYALGATLYGLLARRPPFAAANPAATLLQVLQQDPLPLRLLAPDVPPDLETICHKCLEKDPRRRYGSAAELQADLERFLRDEPIRARPAGPAEIAWRWCRRNPRLAALAAALAVAIVVGVGGVAWQWRQTLAEVRINQHRLYAARMSLSGRDLESENLTPVLERLQLYQPKSGEDDLRSFEWYYLWRQCHRDEQTFSLPIKTHLLAMSLAPTGKWLATAEVGDGKNMAIQIVDAAQGRIAKTISLSQEAREVDFAWLDPEGRRRKSGLPVRYSYFVEFLAFSPDGRWLAAYSDRVRVDGGTIGHRRVVLYDVDSGRQLAALDVKDNVEHVVLSHDLSTLALAMGDRAEIWNVSQVAAGQSPTPIVTGRQHSSRLAFAPGGDVLAATSSGLWVDLYDARTGGDLRRLKRPASGDMRIARDSPGSLAFSPDGKLAAVHSDTTCAVTVWEQASGEFVLATEFDPRSRFGRRPYESMCFSPDNRRVAFASGQIIKVWDTVERREIARLRGHSAPIQGLAFEDAERLVSVAHLSGTGWSTPVELKQWHLPDLLHATALKSNRIAAGAADVAISPDGQWIAIPYASEVRLVEAATNTQVLSLGTPPPANPMPGSSNNCQRVAFSNDGQRLAVAGSVDVQVGPRTGNTLGHLWIYDLNRNEGEWSAKLAESKSLGHWVTGLDFLADGRVVVSDRERVEIVEPATHSSRQVPPKRKDGATDGEGALGSLASDRGGDTLVVQMGYEFQVWNGNTGRLIARAKFWPNSKFPSPLMPMAVSPSGQWLATSHVDNCLRVWDLHRPGRLLKQPARTIKGHDGIVTSLRFHPDGKTLLSGGVDGLIKVWDLATGDERLTLRAHEAPITSLAISADGTSVVSAQQDWVKVWRAASPAEVEQRRPVGEDLPPGP